MKWLLASLMLFGCHRTNVYQVMLPSGETAHAVECETIQRCQQEIWWTCERGYRIIEQSGSMGTRANAIVTGQFSRFELREGEEYVITFICREEIKLDKNPY